jgi:hypothetical protein
MAKTTVLCRFCLLQFEVDVDTDPNVQVGLYHEITPLRKHLLDNHYAHAHQVFQDWAALFDMLCYQSAPSTEPRYDPDTRTWRSQWSSRIEQLCSAIQSTNLPALRPKVQTSAQPTDTPPQA